MAIAPEDRETAETLLRHHKAKKRLECYRRQLNRAVESLAALSQGIQSELDGESGHPTVSLSHGQQFAVESTSRSLSSTRYDLPTAEHLAECTDGYRTALEDVEVSEREVREL